MKIHFVTTNPGKFQEVWRFIAQHAPHITLVQANLDVPELQSHDQRTIALGKAQAAWDALKEPLLVDDSGIYFSHYNKFPGTLTKYVFEGIGFEGIHLLTQDHNQAYFQLHLVYVDQAGTTHIFEGRTDGKIIVPKEYNYHKGFPYDAIFQPDGCALTQAQLLNTPERKEFSCRLRAVKKFLEWFNNTR